MPETDLKQEARRLFKASGWTQAEAARQLNITPGAFSQIIRENSPVKPSLSTLKLFRMLVESRQTEILEKWEIDLIQALRPISPAKRKRMIEVFIAMAQLCE